MMAVSSSSSSVRYRFRLYARFVYYQERKYRHYHPFWKSLELSMSSADILLLGRDAMHRFFRWDRKKYDVMLRWIEISSATVDDITSIIASSFNSILPRRPFLPCAEWWDTGWRDGKWDDGAYIVLWIYIVLLFLTILLVVVVLLIILFGPGFPSDNAGDGPPMTDDDFEFYGDDEINNLPVIGDDNELENDEIDDDELMDLSRDRDFWDLEGLNSKELFEKRMLIARMELNSAKKKIQRLEEELALKENVSIEGLAILRQLQEGELFLFNTKDTQENMIASIRKW
jgi:hypothetical protein